MKKLLGIIAIAAIAAAAGWNFSQSQNEVELSDLAQANIEALARGEGGGIDQDGYKYIASPKACCEGGNAGHKCSDVWPMC